MITYRLGPLGLPVEVFCPRRFAIDNRFVFLGDGSWVFVTLARATERHAEETRLVVEGVDPMAHRKAKKHAEEVTG